jgi:hypothetical protein
VVVAVIRQVMMVARLRAARRREGLGSAVGGFADGAGVIEVSRAFEGGGR